MRVRICRPGGEILTRRVRKSGVRATNRGRARTFVADDRRRRMGDESKGDPESWVDRHGDCLYRYALLRLRNPDLAADVVQETFLDALRSLGSFTGRSSERTWLVGILKHKIVDHLRSASRRQATTNGLAADAEARSDFDRRGEWRVGPASWSGEPGRDIETREFWDVFGCCLSKLPQGLADAFYLRELDGLNSDEVQQILGITPANLWARLHRARSLLRQCLETGWFGRRTTSPPS
jgi:RNA polymerase sigma-70 factor (TIGR02943 family)